MSFNFSITAMLLVWMAAVVDRCLCICSIPGCSCVGEMIRCQPNSLNFMPGTSQIPADKTIMKLNENKFANPGLQPANFSGYHYLVQLELANCGIQSIDSNTFRGAPALKYLDLSENQLGTVAGGAFSGLSLDYLFLANNPNLKLSPTSTTGMSAEVIDLNDCGLTDITPYMFTSMIGTLRKLFLKGNNLTKFSPGTLAIFASLDVLALNDNPLSCDCNIKWLKDFYDRNKNTFKVSNQDVLLTCATPKRLQGSNFNDLLPSDFSCQKPTISNLSVRIASTMILLQCEANGFPAPNITWHLPSGINKFHFADQEAEKTVGEISVGTRDLRALGSYMCVASNDAGNTTSSVNLTQIIPEQHVIPCNDPLTTTGGEVVIPANSNPELETGDQTEYLFMRKYFSLVDLLSAILGTFVGTLIISVVILHFCVYRKKRKSHYSNSSAPMSDYSDSLKTDSPSCRVSNNTAHQMMLRDQHSTARCIQDRPLPNKPYAHARVYDEAQYMSPPLSERDDFDNNFISPYGHLNTMGTGYSDTAVTCSPCEACRNHLGEQRINS